MSKKFNYAIAIPVILMVFLAACKNTSSPNRAWVVSTIAGSTAGFADATGTVAKFNRPDGVAVDKSGNIYVADSYNNRIRMITSAGEVSTLAGSGTRGHTEGTGTAAQFNRPHGVTVYEYEEDGVKKLDIYVADTYNHRIRMITSAGEVSTFAGSSGGDTDATGTAAQFKRPYDVAMYEYEEDGEKRHNIYVADDNNHRIRMITSAGVVSTIAGTGEAAFLDHETDPKMAKFRGPSSVAVYEYEKGGEKKLDIYVADNANHRIRKIEMDSEGDAISVSTLAGSGTAGFADGIGTAAQFDNPDGVAADKSGNIYVADRDNNRIRKITSAGEVSTIAGSTAGFADGIGTVARFDGPTGVAVDSEGNIYVADTYNHRIRKIEYRAP